MNDNESNESRQSEREKLQELLDRNLKEKARLMIMLASLPPENAPENKDRGLAWMRWMAFSVWCGFAAEVTGLAEVVCGR